jgi:hypothetical protein
MLVGKTDCGSPLSLWVVTPSSRRCTPPHHYTESQLRLMEVHIGGRRVHDIHDEIKNMLNSGDACHHSVQNLMSSRLVCKGKGKVKLSLCSS